jgi:hypothetical protein
MMKKFGTETSPRACTAYMYDEKFGPETSPGTFTWPIYMMKKFGPETSLEPVPGLYSLYIYDEKSWSREFPYGLYMVCTAYMPIYIYI